jgi:hypothetical protein
MVRKITLISSLFSFIRMRRSIITDNTCFHVRCFYLKKKGYIEEMIARSSKFLDSIPTIFNGAEIRGEII